MSAGQAFADDDSISAADDVLDLTSFGSNITLASLSVFGPRGVRALQNVGTEDATLVVHMRHDAGAVSPATPTARTIVLKPGVIEPIKAAVIVASGTTASRIRAYW
jgi:hypothetical protein